MTEFQNPNQDPGMEKRLLLVFALVFILLLAFQPLLMKYVGKNQPAPQSPPQQAPAAPPAATTTPANAPPPELPPAASAKVATAEQETVVDTDLYHIVFTNRGALAKSWVLKRFTDDKGQPLELVQTGTSVLENGQLVPAVQRFGYPMSLWTYDDGLRQKLNSALYVVQDQPGADGTRTITFDYSDGGLTVEKVFTFKMGGWDAQTKKVDPSGYLVKVRSEARQNGQLLAAYPAWPSGFGDQTVLPSFAASKVDYYYGDKVTRIDAKKVSGGASIPGPFNWAGVSDQYFGAVFLPDQPDSAALVTLHNQAVIPKNLDKPDPKETIAVPVLGAAVGHGSGVTSGRWFVGPKAVDVIDNIASTPARGQGVGPNLGALVDFGFFGVIAKPLFLWLKWTQQHVVSNWGWAIVILTVIINLALLPLRITSMKSALKMQKVQPQINAIKKKYEKYSMKDPRKAEMNKEIAAVFKEHSVNPAGGCLPLLIQLPFLWAFYQMLANAIELRHAPWLWIHDLSAADPYHVLPVLIVVTTWLMQKWTPNAGMDPAQQRMMNLMMPVMLGFFSWAVASGLGIYWLLGTVIAIIQQFVMNRTALGQEMKEMAAKRARKNALKTT